MRYNDLTQLTVGLLAGLMLGVIGTLAAFSAVSGRQMEAQRQEADEAVQRAQDERDEALTRINEHLDYERKKRQELEQAGPEVRPARAEAPAQPRAEEAAPQGTPVAAAPRAEAGAPQKREVAPAPREQGPAKPRGLPPFGPPRQDGQ